MKPSCIVLFTLLVCAFLNPFQLIGYPLKQKMPKQKDPRFDIKKNNYYFSYITEKSDLYLTLYDEFKYDIVISKRLSFEEEFIAHFVDISISFGKFSINSDESYTFKDIPTGIEFCAYKMGDRLKLAERILMKEDTEETSENDLYQRIYLENLAKIQRLVLRDSCLVVDSGLFVSLDDFVMLNLKSGNEYEFYVLDVPISSGRWSQRNKEIILSDSTITKKLKLIADNDHLICSFMPGNLIGTELYLKEPDKSLDPPISDNSLNPPTTDKTLFPPSSNNKNTKIAFVSIGLFVLISLGTWIVISRKRRTTKTDHHSRKVV